MTIVQSQLKDLERRLAEAKGPDRKIDAAITEALCPCEPPDCIPEVHAVIVAKVLAGGDDSEIESFTASLDAAVSLTERVLPGSGWLIGRGRLKPDEPLYGATVHATDLTEFADEPEELGGGEGSPALALCLACVRALIAQVPNPPEKERT